MVYGLWLITVRMKQVLLKLIYVATLQQNTDVMIIAEICSTISDDAEFCMSLLCEF